MNPKRHPVLTVLLTLLTISLHLADLAGERSCVLHRAPWRALRSPRCTPRASSTTTSNDRIVVADTGLDQIQFYYARPARSSGRVRHARHRRRPVRLPARRRDRRTGQHLRGRRREQPRAVVHVRRAVPVEAGWHRHCDACLNTPIGVTWDAANDVVLVASTGQDLIKAFNATALRVDSRRDGPRRRDVTFGFNAPRDVTRGPDGRIWLSDYDHHRVKAFDVTAAGVWTTTPRRSSLGGDGMAGGTTRAEFNFPYNVDFSPDGQTAYISSTRGTTACRSGTSPRRPRRCSSRTSAATAPSRRTPCADPPADFGYIDTLRRVVVAPDGTVITADFWGNGMQVLDRPTATRSARSSS